MIKIYGHPQTSANRCFWMLEELGLDYENVAVNMKEREHKSPEYLKLNPNGKVPCLDDDGFVIWESMAINHYLAEKYQPEMFGKNLEEKALVTQWSYWALAEYQKPLIDLLIQLVFVPEPKRDAQLIEKSRERTTQLNELLDDYLSDRSNVVQTRFTLADLHVASVASINLMTEMDLSPYKNLGAWLNKVSERPACLKAASLGK
ncbi:glutathione S-transferase family protein [Oligoflexaceae bacterium]|nr:glutathione S-transferase family protein [Oligoflexaceae bacterium]